MAELHIGVRPDVRFYLAPIAIVVADFLARSADGQNAFELLDFEQGLPQVFQQMVAPLNSPRQMLNIALQTLDG